MSKVQDPKAKWDATFADNVSLSDLRAAIRRTPQHNPCIKGYRSVCWKAFLLYQNLDRNTWTKSTRDSRSAYGSLKEHLMQVFELANVPPSNDPLAEVAKVCRSILDPGSEPLLSFTKAPWQSLKEDEALRAEILQDVERCMPEISFFREVQVQAMLLNVLFVYCKINADLGYRQGMHELLAPILWVVHQDAASIDKSSALNQDKTMGEVLDPQFVEHDSFSLFCIVMQTAKSFYETNPGTQQSPGGRGESPIVERSRRIHEDFLSKADPELASHLTSIDILPQIFVIRWIRLLFGREFKFANILCLWDMIFAEDPALNLVDHVCVIMLLRIRWQLLEADYSSALTLLLRYPEPQSSADVPALVGDAVYLSKHMNLQGGSTIVRKYSGKSPLAALAESGGEPVKRKGAHTPRASVDINRTMSPLRTPADYIQNHGGIEAILQGAAKNVYSRSEQWGLNKAIRGAVQNLQNNTLTPPRPQGGGGRWSLDEGKIIGTDPKTNTQALKSLEERNKVLAGMLGEALEELNTQAKSLEGSGAESAATALTLTTAKLHYLQVYLQDSQLPLEAQGSDKKEPSERQSPRKHTDNSPLAAGVRSPPGSPTLQSRTDGSSTGQLLARRNRSPLPVATKSTLAAEAVKSPTDQYQTDPLSSSSLDSAVASAAAVSPRARPSLTSSQYSWMLGEDKPKTELVSETPFAAPTPKPRDLPDRQRNSARSRASFLFGEDDGTGGKSAGSGLKPGAAAGAGDDGFVSPTLTGGNHSPATSNSRDAAQS